MRRKGVAIFAASCLAAFIACGNPLMVLRFTAAETASDGQWAKTLAMLKANRGACDEVWFSTDTGVPPLEWHREHASRLVRYAEQCREAGIAPSLQIQATIGHNDGDAKAALGGTGGKDWRGYTGRGGAECRYCNCPRDERFIAYMSEVARLYAAFRPASVWVDDDLRLRSHVPAQPWTWDGIGCWCSGCIAAFNAETGGNWTRETLDKAMGDGGELFEKWRTFSYVSLSNLAREISAAVHAVSPKTTLAYQFSFDAENAHLKCIFKAMHEATGLPVGSRSGGGRYYDYDPHGQILKCYDSMRSRKALGDPEWIRPWCPEVETWPRTFAARTAQGIMNEAFAALALGMDSVSLFITKAGKEPEEWYSRSLLGPLSAERPFFDRYVSHNAGTLVAGLSDETQPRSEEDRKRVYLFALAGVPVLTGPGRSCGKIVKSDLFGDVSQKSSSELLALRRSMDKRAGGALPVLVESPSIGVVVPRVAQDGTLRSVAMLNARIDVQSPLALRLRKMPQGAATAVWHEMRGESRTLPVACDGGDALVEVPALSAWNWGWLEIAGK